jgi:MPBQ/MSBQ methyltransferase
MARSTTRELSAKHEVRALFDSLALEYVRSREHQFSFVAQKRLVVGMLAEARGRLLEVGCGPAVMTPDLLAMGFQVQGVDVSPEMLRRARLRMAGHPLAQRCRFSAGDFEQLAFPDACFDAVLAMGVLEYLADYGAALREIHRVLRPGGIAMLAGPLRPRNRWARRLADAWMLFPTEQEYRAWFAAAGFADVEVLPLAPAWYEGDFAVAVAGRKERSGASPVALGALEGSGERMTPRRWARFAAGSLAGLAFVPVALAMTARARLQRRGP